MSLREVIEYGLLFKIHEEEREPDRARRDLAHDDGEDDDPTDDDPDAPRGLTDDEIEAALAAERERVRKWKQEHGQ